MKRHLSITLGKIAEQASKLIKRNRSYIPGLISQKIEPDILNTLAPQLEKTVIVSGTNGKTTTSGFLVELLKTNDDKVLYNQSDNNSLLDITTSFINDVNIYGKLKSNIGVIESNEIGLPKILKHLKPQYIIFTNFSNQHFDSYNNVEKIIEDIEKAIKPLNVTLILNADDPLVMKLQKLKKPTILFGISKTSHSFEKYENTQSINCPCCSKPLNYSHIHYGHLGYYDCSCGFKRPKPHYEIKYIRKESEGYSFKINNEMYLTKVAGIYNLYNLVSSIAASYELGLNANTIHRGLSQINQPTGNLEIHKIHNKNHLVNVVKNAESFNIALSEFVSDMNPNKKMIITLNDYKLDGKDISWIWNVDFERLNKTPFNKIICSGNRGEEIALRLKYAGIPEYKFTTIKDNEEAINDIIKHQESIYHFSSYTSLETITNLLRKKGGNTKWN